MILIGPLGAVVLVLTHLIVIGLDIVCFFVVVRLLVDRLRVPLLVGLDRAGTVLIEAATSAVGRLCPRVSQRGRLALLTLLLATTRIGVQLVGYSLLRMI